MTDQSIDITPSTPGLIAYARTIERSAEPGSKDALVARMILIECGVNPDHRISEIEFRRAAPATIDGIEIVELTGFDGGSIDAGRRAAATALTRTHGRYSTHTLVYRSEDSEFFLNAGHYDFATEAEARADAAVRHQG